MSKDHSAQGPFSYQEREQYPPSHQQGSYPSISSYNQQSPRHPPTSSAMLTLPPPAQMSQQDPYRPHPPQYDMYQGQPGQMPYPPPPHQQQQQPPVNFAQPAPRQRTAIACRYCRRRKIRCHGFDSQPDGRCTNCVRFHQECIFTPVSSQAHAFVPAHTAYPHLRNTGGRGDGRGSYPPGQGPVVYGAHGQPLGPVGQQGHESNYPPPPGPGQAYGPGPYPAYDERGHLPPDHSRGPAPRRGSGAAYEYPDPTHMAPVSPASSTTSYQSTPYPPGQQPYYAGQHPPPRRTSPQSGYNPYETPRASGSPHGSASSTSFTYPGGLHPPQVLPPAYETGRTPPPNTTSDRSSTTNGTRGGMSVRDMLGPGDSQGGRSSADSDMLKALNRRGM